MQQLSQLAGEFITQKAYPQAIKCLQAATTIAEQPPATTASARVVLAQLLLDHFDNQSEAGSHLRLADLELRQVSGHVPLKCEVLDSMARCQLASGNPEQSKDTLMIALATSRPGAATPKERSSAIRWHVFFYFRLAQHELSYVSPSAALSALKPLLDTTAFQLTPFESILVLLCMSLLHLLSGDHEAANESLVLCGEKLEEEVEKANTELDNETPESDRRHLVAQHLRCHFTLLYSLMLQSNGSINQLLPQENHQPDVMDELHCVLAEVKDEEWSYGWAPLGAVVAAASILHAGVLRGAGKPARAALQLGNAEEVLEESLRAIKVDMDEQNEKSLSSKALLASKCYLLLRVVVLHERTLLSLLTSNFTSSVAFLKHAILTIEKFPETLASMAPNTHFLCGLYLHSVGDWCASKIHFKHVITLNVGADITRLAALGAALCDLEIGGDGAAGRALESLSLGGATLEDAAQPPAILRAVTLLTHALIALQQKDTACARMHLTKALKQAHSVLGNTQLVGQVLNCLAPIQLAKSDIQGAGQMFESALTLLKGVGDLPSMLTTLSGMSDMYASESNDQLAEKNAEYMGRKKLELMERVSMAIGLPDHAKVVEWRMAV